MKVLVSRLAEEDLARIYAYVAERNLDAAGTFPSRSREGAGRAWPQSGFGTAPRLENTSHPPPLLGHQPLPQLPHSLRAGPGRRVD